MVTIKRSGVDAIFGARNVDRVLELYAAESSIAGLGQFNPHQGMYKAMEDNGVVRTLTAHDGDDLVGMLVFLVSVLPHYSQVVATSESYFVLPEYRSTGAGLQLLHEAQDWAAELGATGLFISAPTDSRLAKVMPRMGYEATNVVFYRGLQHE